MERRENVIIKTILGAFLSDPRPYSLLQKILAFFAIFSVPLQRYEYEQFQKLRIDAWNIDEEHYLQSFGGEDEHGRLDLYPLSELGYSGSTFFETLDHRYLIKSLPRGSESKFFKYELKNPYCHYMRNRPGSLLVRMTDFLYSPVWTLGGLLKVVPEHHVVMENILHGKESDPQGGRWESYDLKPADYFYPERDVLDGNLVSAEAQDKVVDHFKDKIRITKDQSSELKETIKEDTEFLKTANTVDYSLFLVRYPADSSASAGGSWRTGILSRDKKWIYRAVILDFFWSKHKLPAKAMTALIRTYNTFDEQGPMSLTTSASEFSNRFRSMVGAFIEEA